MKIQWAWRISVLAVLALIAFQTESCGQMPYGQPYPVPPQMVYGPSGPGFVYGPGMVAPAGPYAVPTAYYGDPQAMVPVNVQPGYDTGAGDEGSGGCSNGSGACGDGSGEYLLHNGYGVSPLGRYLAGVLSLLAPYSETGCLPRTGSTSMPKLSSCVATMMRRMWNSLAWDLCRATL